MFIEDTHVKTPFKYIVSQLLKNGLLLTVSKLHQIISFIMQIMTKINDFEEIFFEGSIIFHIFAHENGFNKTGKEVY